MADSEQKPSMKTAKVVLEISFLESDLEIHQMNIVRMTKFELGEVKWSHSVKKVEIKGVEQVF